MLGATLGAAFGSNKINRLPYWAQGDANLDTLGAQFAPDNAAAMADIARFRTGNARTIADLARERARSTIDYNRLFDRSMEYDPLANYNAIRTGNFRAIGGVGDRIGDWATAASKLNEAALGRGGRFDSYDKAGLANRISSNILPLYNTALGTTGYDTGTVGNEFGRGLDLANRAIMSRQQVPLLGYGMELDPTNALMNVRNWQTNLLGNQVGISKANTAGWQKEQNWADRLAAVDKAGNESLDDIINKAGKVASIAGSVYSGGATGALGGMMGGGGGGMGGGGSGGIASMLKDYFAKNKSSSNFGGYDYSPGSESAGYDSWSQN